MDFTLFFGVVKRYKRVVIPGALLAVVLAVLSYGTPGLKGGKPTIVPRGSELWQGTGEILVSQSGFPYGRAASQVIPGKGTTTPPEVVGDPSYMANLSSVYAALANGTYVQNQVAAETHVRLCPQTVSATGSSSPASGTAACASVVAAGVAQPGTGNPLPLITLTSSAPTAGEAATLAATSISVLQSDITKEQVAAGTTADQRIVLQTIMTGAPATLTQAPSKSTSMLVLFAVLSASIALAFILNSHSKDPVRSTRRRPDEGVGPDGGLSVSGADYGRAAQPEHGRIQTGGAKLQQDRHWTGRDRQLARLLRDSGSEPKSRD